MLSPRLASQMAGSATPRMVRPRRYGCSSSIRRISANCRSGVHSTPSSGVPVQPYSSNIRYTHPSKSTAHQPQEKGLAYPKS